MPFVKYSGEFKYGVVRAAIEGKTLTEINNSLASTISSDSLTRWTRLYERTRAVVCDPQTYRTRGRPFLLNEEDLTFLNEMLVNQPTLYLDEIQAALIEQHGVHVGLSAISNTLHRRLHMSQKTIRTFNPRQDMDARGEYIALIGSIPACCLVFTDESGVSLEVVQRTKGWAPIGQRTPRVPRERSTHQYNIIPAISSTGLVAHLAQEDTVNREDFEYFLEEILLPSMNPFPDPRSVLVLDNAQIHHNGRVAELVEERGCLIQYLPAYSPDLNPIEKGFSVYKAALRRYEELLTGGEDDYDIIEGFISLVFTAELSRKLFLGAGYAVA